MPTDLRAKDISDWIKIVVVLVGLGMGWQNLTEKIDRLTAIAHDAEVRSTRVEIYLSSRDSKYWETTRTQTQPETEP